MESKPPSKKTQRPSRRLARSSDEDQGVRKRVIAGNWKMHMTCAQARDYMAAFLPLITDLPDDRTVVLAPPFTAVSTMAELAAGSCVEISSQACWRPKGIRGDSPDLLEHKVRYGSSYSH